MMLTGCGFHLRGSLNPVNLPFEQVSLKPNQPYDRFHQHLGTILSSHKINVQDEADWQLVLSPLNLKSFPLAYGPNGELVREKLQLSLHAQLIHNGQTLYSRQLTNERQHQLNIATKLADAAELEIILKEMQQDLASQLMLQIANV